MKMNVVHKNGTVETLTLTEPLELKRGEAFNLLVTSTGMEYWFEQDGYYDGWGRACNIPTENPEVDGLALAEAISNEREFPAEEDQEGGSEG